MSVLPRVTEHTRERISREFDDLGPEACMAEIRADLQRHNPELLDMASRWAGDGGETKSLMTALRSKRPRVRLDPESYLRLRQSVLERDRWRCQNCGSTNSLQVHHVRARSSLGDDTTKNLLTL